VIRRVGRRQRSFCHEEKYRVRERDVHQMGEVGKKESLMGLVTGRNGKWVNVGIGFFLWPILCGIPCNNSIYQNSS
jgi:hypothetical protein